MNQHDLSTLEGQHLHWKEARQRIKKAAIKVREKPERKASIKSCGRVLCDVPFPLFRSPPTYHHTSFERIALIQKVVARHFNITVTDILGDRRSLPIVRPRQIAMYFATKLTTRSLPEIARRFGGKDHTTVLHASRRIPELTNTEPAIASAVASLERELNELL